MKIFALTLLALAFGRPSSAQYWIVADNDGFVNVRDSAGTSRRITDTLHNGHFIYIVPDEVQTGAWRNVLYHHMAKDSDRYGYIFFDRLKAVEDYDSIPLRNYIDNTATCSRDSVKVIVTQQKFDKTKYRISYGDRYIARINGKPYWGTDGEMPRHEYKSITILIGTRKIILPHAAFDNLFEPTIWNTEVHYDRVSDIIYIRSQNSDGAGSYDVIWRIVKGVYTDRDIITLD